MGLRDLRQLGSAYTSAQPRRKAARRTSVGLIFAIVTAAGLSGCGHEIPDVNLAAEEFASALRNGTLDEIPFNNATNLDAQTQFRDTLTPLLSASGQEDPQVTLGEVTENPATENDAPRTATATLEWVWPFGESDWTYETTALMTLFEPGFGQAREPRWEFNWDPTMLLPPLQAGETIETRIVPPTRADILDGDGNPLVTDRAVVHLGIDKATAIDNVQMSEGQLEDAAHTLARKVRNAGHAVDVDAYVTKVAHAGPRDFVELIALRADDDLVDVERALQTIPGSAATEAHLPLGPTDDFAAGVLGTAGLATNAIAEQSGGRILPGEVAGLSGLQLQYDAQLAGTSGVQVVASGPHGERALFTRPAVPGTTLTTTFDVALQKRAEEVLANINPAAAIVAIRPSTGEIVAAASGPGSQGNDTALQGQYAPGTAFWPISALALARNGVSAYSTVPCTSDIEVEGHPIQNFSDFPDWALGDVTLQQAFVRGCSTAFVAQAEHASQAELVTAARDLGFGVLTPLGIPAFFGDIPADADTVQHAASILGQDRVLASPFTMARVAASIGAGHRVDPFLVRAEAEDATATDPTSADEGGLTAAEASALRDLMRAYVNEATYYLPYIDGLTGAKSGTAQAAGGQLHAWMIATTNSASPVGELAIAVFVEAGQGGTTTAAPILYKFITGREVPPPPAPVITYPEDGEEGDWTGGGGGAGNWGGGGWTDPGTGGDGEY